MTMWQRPVAALLRRHPVASFFFTAYALSWSYWIALALAHQRVTIGGASSHVPGLFGPLVAALFVTRVAEGPRAFTDLLDRMMRCRIATGWALLAGASPLFVLALTAIAMAALGWPWPRWEDLGLFNGIPAVTPVGVWLILIVAAFGEEAGWRGFALPHLEQGYSPLAASLAIALLWAGWHLPLFFIVESYRGFSAGTLVGFVLGVASGAIVLTWLYHRTRDSIVVVAMWHGSFNLATGTRAAHGAIAAVVSTGVMLAATVLVILEFRAQRTHRTVVGPHR